MTENGKPWERRERETAKAFQAFQTFLTMPADKRSVRDAYFSLNPSASMVGGSWYRWSSEHNWNDRATAHDESIHHQVLAKQEQSEIVLRTEELEKYRRVVKGQSTAIANINRAFIQAFSERVSSSPLNLDNPDDRALIRLFQSVTETTRKGHEMIGGAVGLDELVLLLGVNQ